MILLKYVINNNIGSYLKSDFKFFMLIIVTEAGTENKNNKEVKFLGKYL